MQAVCLHRAIVIKINYCNRKIIVIGAETIRCKHVIAAYGKFNALDKTIRKNPPYRAKFHVQKHMFAGQLKMVVYRRLNG